MDITALKVLILNTLEEATAAQQNLMLKQPYLEKFATSATSVISFGCHTQTVK
ncbi:hypothetical protein HDU78_011687, partial [Chytriomyces hyalinus]